MEIGGQPQAAQVTIPIKEKVLNATWMPPLLVGGLKQMRILQKMSCHVQDM